MPRCCVRASWAPHAIVSAMGTCIVIRFCDVHVHYSCIKCDGHMHCNSFLRRAHALLFVSAMGTCIVLRVIVRIDVCVCVVVVFTVAIVIVLCASA